LFGLNGASPYKPKRSLKAKKGLKAMSKGRHLFRETELRRAVRAAESAGMKIGRVEIDSTGKISLIPSDDAEATNVERSDQWDTALK
jgi:hypothetical protein